MSQVIDGIIANLHSRRNNLIASRTKRQNAMKKATGEIAVYNTELKEISEALEGLSGVSSRKGMVPPKKKKSKKTVTVNTDAAAERIARSAGLVVDDPDYYQDAGPTRKAYTCPSQTVRAQIAKLLVSHANRPMHTRDMVTLLPHLNRNSVSTIPYNNLQMFLKVGPGMFIVNPAVLTDP